MDEDMKYLGVTILVFIACFILLIYGFYKGQEMNAAYIVVIIALAYFSKYKKISSGGEFHTETKSSVMDWIIGILCLSIFLYGFLRNQELMSLTIIATLLLGYFSLSRKGLSNGEKESASAITCTAMHKAIPGGQIIFYAFILFILIVGFMKGFILTALLIIFLLLLIDPRSIPLKIVTFRNVILTLFVCSLFLAYGFWRNQFGIASVLTILIYYFLPSVLQEREPKKSVTE